jgi:hypothetical protein
VLAHDDGAHDRQMVKDDIRLSTIATRDGFENAILIHCGDRRLDQCGDPPAGPGRTAGHSAFAGRISTPWAVKSRCWST